MKINIPVAPLSLVLLLLFVSFAGDVVSASICADTVPRLKCTSPDAENVCREGRVLSGTAIVVCMSFFICFSIHQISVEWVSSHYSLTTAAKITQEWWKLEEEDGKKMRSVQKPAALMHCDRSRHRYDLCQLDGPTVMYPTNITFLVQGPTTLKPLKIRPYPRKWEPFIMAYIKELTFSATGGTGGTGGGGECQVRHEAPALVFSTGGYTGNFYHDFSDGFVPLFVTTRTLFHHLRGEEGQQGPVLVVSEFHNWWLSRYAELLRGFTRWPIINLDMETKTHCFPSVKIGLIAHEDMFIDPSRMPNSESLRDFHALVHRSYSSAAAAAAVPHQRLLRQRRPRLVVVARVKSVGRAILNQEEIIRAAEEVGFEVRVFAPTTTTALSEAYRVINSSHAMMGVHGAALTHMFFLRPGAVFLQVVALGLHWVADVCFGRAAQHLGLEYMEYKITVEESTLVDKYSRDDLVLRDPKAVVKKGWNYTNLYLKEQDVRLDLVRITTYLKKAYRKAHKLLLREEQHTIIL
ncbi:hypothetical protein H6P81_019883 [Aristolochia fimbriata]|uniref:Glycosyltransferase 61 catalytic domain-containing protein n=1 Tax=Aristolochia fimbriata TaxID=158543 RepID=A0AAV7DT09_ARIFI|nr:hypothetical protein H6P81_019883 [Aristolochia fimbriata]